MTNNTKENKEDSILTDLMCEEYPFTAIIRDKEFKFRSWKIKDKKNYFTAISKINELTNTNEENENIVKEIRQSLVLNCIQGNDPITPDEYQYLLIVIRCKSINHEIEITLNCDKCEKDFEIILNLNTAIKVDASNFTNIIVNLNNNKTLKFKMGRIKSQEIYDNYISKSVSQFESLFVDFVQHVQSINGKIINSEDKFKIFNTIDVNVFEEIIKQWEPQRFKIDNEISVICSHCNHVESVIVDDIPGFFPLSWTD